MRRVTKNVQFICLNVECSLISATIIELLLHEKRYKNTNIQRNQLIFPIA